MKRLACFAAIILLATPILADDGVLFVKNIPKTPELESDHARLELLELYVPAQTSDGNLPVAEGTCSEGEIFYDFEDDAYTDECRGYAKPLISIYHDGHADLVESAPGFKGHGERDIFAATSLDDGATWKRVNLSDSARFSSINIGGEPYPGDVINTFAASGGNKVLAVWPSRFCQSGSPTYAIDPDDSATEYAGLINAAQTLVPPIRNLSSCDVDPDDWDTSPCLYLDDLFAVTGAQRDFDMGDEGFPEVGELPYACLWAARGTLEKVTFDAEGAMVYDPTGESEQHGIIWRKPERLTSGRRDVNRVEAAAEPGAGFVVTWQEDPEGLRPGLGEGPGNGFSGAIAHGKTDVWYSYIPWEAFDLVDDNTDGLGLYGDPVTLDEYFGDLGQTEGPKVGIPMSIPVRLTDNNKCDNTTVDPVTLELKPLYCHIDFDGNGIEDFCAGTAIVPTKTSVTEVCYTEDGRLLRGNVAATRPRTNLRPYDSDGDGLNDSAWVVIAAEESKGLGEEDDDEADKVDMGKNAYYYTFDMFEPEIVSQGLHLNQPAVYPTFAKDALGDLTLEWESYLYEPVGPDLQAQWLATVIVDPLYDLALDYEVDSTLYQTEIARRTSLITQSAAGPDGPGAGGSGSVALVTWKQGIVQRGGPADVLARRFVIPAGFDPMVDNPYAYSNMECGEWAFTDITNGGSNPRYVKGLCKSPPLNLSGTTIVECTNADGSTAMEELDCFNSFPWNDNFDDYDTSEEGSFFAWQTLWRMCEEGETLTPIEGDAFSCLDSDIDDQTWENPFDLSKGHRGFMDGDFIMMLYAWSPNWKANKVGHDNYNFYVRRSFDGGATWTTTPPTLDGDGTTHCETYRDGGKGDPNDENTTLCFTYDGGEFEQARNISRFPTVHLTVLDPRYTPTAPAAVYSLDFPEPTDGPYADNERDHSKYVVTYETGDNTTTAEGEPEPLDMFYGRAYNWGDNYELFESDELDPSILTECDETRMTDPENECYFDGLEHHHDVASSEATLRANSAGNFFYAVWAEFGEEEVVESDISFRRIMWFFDETSADPQDGLSRVFDLSVGIDGFGSGNVTGDYLGSTIVDCGLGGTDCGETVAAGLSVDVDAAPAFDSYFEEWQGDDVSTNPALQLSMTEDLSLTALFQPECVTNDLVIDGMECTEDEFLTACQSLLIQGSSLITSTGKLTVAVGSSMSIDNGFVMEDGAELEVRIESILVP